MGSVATEEDDISHIMHQITLNQNANLPPFSTTCEPPSRRCNATLVTNPLQNNELVLFGGEFFNGKTCSMYNDLYKYIIDKREWRQIVSSTMPNPRSSHQCVVMGNGLMFVWGGKIKIVLLYDCVV